MPLRVVVKEFGRDETKRFEPGVPAGQTVADGFAVQGLNRDRSMVSNLLDEAAGVLFADYFEVKVPPGDFKDTKITLSDGLMRDKPIMKKVMM
jgi:hypothetical protein